MKKIDIYTNHFMPENFRLNDIAEELAKKYDVTVTTQIPNYPNGKYYQGYGILKKRKENIKNIFIRRLLVIPRGKNKIMLSLNYLSYMITSFFTSLFFKKKQTDLVFIYITSPIFISWAAIRHANEQKVPKIMYLLDLWPENLFKMIGIKSKFIKERLTRMCVKIYKEMDIILIGSLSFKNELIKYGIKEEKIILFPQHEILKDYSRKKEINQEMINILFAGNIGEAQGLDLLVELSKALKKDNITNIHFQILGDGRHKEALVENVKSNQVNGYFSFYKGVPYSEVAEFYDNADYGLVILEDDSTINKHLPAKVQGYMANGIPIVAFASGETKRVIEESGSGIVIEHDNITSMAKKLQKIREVSDLDYYEYSKSGYEYAKRNYDFNKIIRELENIIKEEMRDE